MSVSLEKILALFPEAVVVGDRTVQISSPCPLDEPIAGGAAFVRSERTVDVQKALTEKPVSALFVHSSIAIDSVPTGKVLIKLPDPQKSFFTIYPLFFPVYFPQQNKSGSISEKASVDPTAKISPTSTIHAFVSIGKDAVIGEHTIIHPNATIYQGVTIGKNCVIHSGVVLREFVTIKDNVTIQPGAIIGADGFGYIFESSPAPKIIKVPQVGAVVIGTDVEIGANTCVDRGALGDTTIGQQTKLDNLVQIGHNVKIGALSIMCGAVAVGGSTNIGNGVTLGGQVGVSDHMTIVDGVRVAGGSAVITNLTEKNDYAGFPAIPVIMWRRATVWLRKQVRSKNS